MISDLPETKRANPRSRLRERAQVALPGEPVLGGTTIDVSTSGVSIMVHEQIPGGAACWVRFEIPDGGRKNIVQAQAKAIYSVCVGEQGFRVGFQFTFKDPERTQLINAL